MKFDQCNKKSLFCCVCSFLRRNLSLLLILALLPMCLALPVMADEVDDPRFFNVLDFGYPEGQGSNYIPLDGSGSQYVRYVNPSNVTVTFIDIIFRTDSPDFRLESYYENLTIVDLGQGYFRAFGLQNVATSSFYFLFHYSSGSFLEIVKFDASYGLSHDSTSVNVSGIAMGLPNQMFSFSYPENSFCNWVYDSYEQFEGAHTYGAFKFDYRFPDWRKYDYIDLQLSLIVGEITSVSAYIGDQNVPLDVSFVQNTTQTGNYYLFVTADLRGFDRDTSELLTIVVTGTSQWQLTNQNNILDVSGMFVVEGPSLWSYWFGSVRGWLYSLGQSFTSGLLQVRESFANTISTQTNAITSSLSTWGQSIVDTVNGSFSAWFTPLFNWLQTMNTNIQTTVATISSGVDRIVDAITGGDNVDDLQQGADQIGEAGSSLGSNIGSIQDFEDQYFGQLDTNMGTIISGGNISGIVAPLAFVQRYTNMIVAGIPSNFLVIFTLPILLGIFMFMVNHRIKVPRPDRSSDYVTHEVGGHKNDGNS